MVKHVSQYCGKALEDIEENNLFIYEWAHWAIENKTT